MVIYIYILTTSFICESFYILKVQKYFIINSTYKYFMENFLDMNNDFWPEIENSQMDSWEMLFPSRSFYHARSFRTVTGAPFYGLRVET